LGRQSLAVKASTLTEQLAELGDLMGVAEPIVQVRPE
jgi:hypothetical protein